MIQRYDSSAYCERCGTSHEAEWENISDGEYVLFTDHQKEMKAATDKCDRLTKALADLTSSIECYRAREMTNPDEWDEYDFMMIPRWVRALRLLEKLKEDSE